MTKVDANQGAPACATEAIVFDGPERLIRRQLNLTRATADDVLVETLWTGVSTGTERLLFTGEMPPFPGLGYPLVPGYEAVGEVIEGDAEGRFRPGERVFVPGANCYDDGVRGLFGASAARLHAPAARLARLDADAGPEATLLALAATAHHALAPSVSALRADDAALIVGHGALGRLLARLAALVSGAPPVVWERDAQRRAGAHGYDVLAPDDDPRRDYAVVFDVSGDPTILDTLIGRLARGGEIVLAGFYADRPSFDFPAAFMREARLRCAAEWRPDDLSAVRDLVAAGRLSLDDLITHTAPAARAEEAYPTAFFDPACLKMIIDWRSAR